MTHREQSVGKSDDWYTPSRVFEALETYFTLDVAAPFEGPLHVPARSWISADSLESTWYGYVWMNPPFGGRNGLAPWLDKFFYHRNGIALTPDRTSAPWWRKAADRADGALFVTGKLRFIPADGRKASCPAQGTTLWAAGDLAVSDLVRAQQNGLGIMFYPNRKSAA